jgi:hypothetical protein
MTVDKNTIVHECIRDESFKEMTNEFKILSNKTGSLVTDIALVTRDVTDLKQVTVTMSDCIKALTESSIRSSEQNITRDQFYAKIDELNMSRHVIVKESMDEFHSYVLANDTRAALMEKTVSTNQTTLTNLATDYYNIKKWAIGISATIITSGVLGVGYFLLRMYVMHAP